MKQTNGQWCTAYTGSGKVYRRYEVRRIRVYDTGEQVNICIAYVFQYSSLIEENLDTGSRYEFGGCLGWTNVMCKAKVG